MIASLARADVFDDINAKLDLILKALKVTAPVVPPPVVPPPVVPPSVPPPPPVATCTVTTTGGKFSVGDTAQVQPASGGLNVRTLPDIDTPALDPPQPINSKGKVVCVQVVSGAQWVKVDYDSGQDGWSRETWLDKVGGAVVPPAPPPVDPILPAPTDATYFAAPNGNDANDGKTIATPLRLISAIKKLKPGEVVVVRGGEYETGDFMENGQSIIPSGESWQRPVQIRAYPGEKPVLRRFLPPGMDEGAVAASPHMATKPECDVFMAARGRTSYSYPRDCWTGSGSDPTGLYVQGAISPYSFGSVIRFQRTPAPSSLQYIIFDGIDIDAKGIVGNAITFPESPNCSNWQSDTCSGKHIRFQNLAIKNSILSCMNQPGVGDLNQIATDIQFINVDGGPCGVPYDKNRRPPTSTDLPFFHFAYAHSCENMLINSRIFGSAGTGVSFDCDKNIIRGNRITDNNAHGIYISGGHDWTVENNIVINNGGAQITLYGGHGHQIRHNTLIQTIPGVAQYGLLFNTNASDSVAENNIIVGAPYGVANLGQITPRLTVRNNLVFGSLPGREYYDQSGSPLMIQSGNLIGDPKLDANFVPMAGSPAIKAASDGLNIGARQ